MSGPLTWVLASQNAHKVRELVALLRPHGITVESLEKFPGHPELLEEGSTFLDNARSKAWIMARYAKRLTLADDSGLEVEALGGAPGVISARYASSISGGNASDQANNEKLLRELARLAPKDRRARYRCVLVLADPLREREWSFEGSCEGVIVDAPRGANGFGYDPYFLVPEFGRTMGEMTLAEKSQVSHRAKALQKLLAALPEIAKSL